MQVQVIVNWIGIVNSHFLKKEICMNVTGITARTFAEEIETDQGAVEGISQR
ncbi:MULTISPECIES: hypothetical protein [Shewanella]|uniref:hypothetical protein n=1 Tax=Shewanella TaxID=22 RepID=UPI00163DE057|nr:MULTISPECIES: hypothetical protein [Shewanella]